MPAHHGMVMAVRLGHRAHAAEVRWRPPGITGQQLGQRAGDGADLAGTRVGRQQLGDIAAENGGARGFQPDDGDAGLDGGVESVQAAPQLPASAV